jgi:hypothetical protein
LELEFEDLVAQLYLAEGFRIISKLSRSDKGYDFKLKSPEDKIVIFEVKLYRTRVIARDLVVRAATALETQRKLTGADRAILVIGSNLNIPIKEIGETEVVDMAQIRGLVAKHPMLTARFEALSRQISPMPVASDAEILSARILGDAYIGAKQPEIDTDSQAQRGGLLSEALRSVKPGKQGARQFEERGSDALKYIFENDFSNWSLQKVSDSGISRFDLVARIASEHDFWLSIVTYFKTWYVVFEFKNHQGRISQGQIYSTEKYLFVPAMRSVAFIVSRKGADKNALAATRGAVRESGKLMVSLSVDDICKMLDMKDNGDDPNTLLYEFLDGMLMRLER